jgi:CelD/BcsL family acetyltransferase involved in cellulose biosynthesis
MFGSYPFIKLLAEEKKNTFEKGGEQDVLKTGWIAIFLNTFFSTGYEINKQKET